MRIDELANRYGNRLTETDLKVLSFLRGNQTLCGDMSCEELAFACHISRTTLLRFCRKLGLDSFAELHYLLKDGKAEKGTDFMDLQEVCQAYHRMVDEIRNFSFVEICDLIFRADTLYIYGTGNAQKAEAEELKRIFLSVGKCVIDLFDLGEVEFASQEFTAEDLFIIISLSGETPMGLTVLRAIEHTGIETLSITRWDNNSISRLCRHSLYVGTRTLQGYQNLSYEMTAGFYVLLDILFVNYLNDISHLNDN